MEILFKPSLLLAVVLVGRYVDDEKLGGAWYLGDCFDEDTCLANDLFVNAWMPLPEPYREDEEDGK